MKIIQGKTRIKFLVGGRPIVGLAVGMIGERVVVEIGATQWLVPVSIASETHEPITKQELKR